MSAGASLFVSAGEDTAAYDEGLAVGYPSRAAGSQSRASLLQCTAAVVITSFSL